MDRYAVLALKGEAAQCFSVPVGCESCNREHSRTHKRNGMRKSLGPGLEARPLLTMKGQERFIGQVIDLVKKMVQ